MTYRQFTNVDLCRFNWKTFDKFNVACYCVVNKLTDIKIIKAIEMVVDYKIYVDLAEKEYVFTSGFIIIYDAPHPIIGFGH
jgi:hypothetical protein